MSDTVGYIQNTNDDSWVMVKDGTSYSFSDCPVYSLDNSQLQSAGYIDSTGNLVTAHDAATAHLGAPWRMPTYVEMQAFVSNCDATWTTQGGVYGRLVKGRGTYASKSIFLPAAGFGYDLYLYAPGWYGGYMSSTPCSEGSINGVWFLSFGVSGFDRGYYDRGSRQSIRPVRGFAK